MHCAAYTSNPKYCKLIYTQNRYQNLLWLFTQLISLNWQNNTRLKMMHDITMRQHVHLQCMESGFECILCWINVNWSILYSMSVHSLVLHAWVFSPLVREQKQPECRNQKINEHRSDIRRHSDNYNKGARLYMVLTWTWVAFIKFSLIWCSLSEINFIVLPILFCVCWKTYSLTNLKYIYVILKNQSLIHCEMFFGA